MANARLRWVPLASSATLNAEVKKATDLASGAYVVRTKRGHGVVYVGESHVGRMWRTILRHFQADNFRKDLPRFKRPEDYEVAWTITSRGPRAKSSPDEKAMAAQARWIARFKPLRNVDDGLAEDDSFAFGANVEPEGAFDSLLNPAGPLTEMGVLTSLSVGAPSKRALAWPLKDAPRLAYDGAGRLFVVYAGRIVRASSPKEVSEYKRTHWGLEGPGHVRSGGIAPSPYKDLGPATSITYTTRKGTDARLVDYVHPFGEGSSRRVIYPRVLEHVCRGGCKKGCAAAGALALSGGSYTVESRGIVG